MKAMVKIWNGMNACFVHSVDVLSALRGFHHAELVNHPNMSVSYHKLYFIILYSDIYYEYVSACVSA